MEQSKLEELLALQALMMQSMNASFSSLCRRLDSFEQKITPSKSPSFVSSFSIKNFETKESSASEKASQQSVDHSNESTIYFDEADALIELQRQVELKLHHVSQEDYRVHQVSHVQHDSHDYETKSYSEFENFQQQYEDEHPSQQELLNLWEQFNSHRSHDSEENSSQPDHLYESESYSCTDENKFLDHDNYLSSDENESLDPGGYQSPFSDASQESSYW